ncbi:MAG TPA: thioesterase family protein [Gallionellaceae bacterium]|nr:thioesterase family protein [Gallionellaceae bacterium]
MNLLLRILYVGLRALFKERIPIGASASHLSLRVMPNDLDLNLHMNNGRYLSICDLNRVDLFIRSGLLKTMIKRRWIAVIAEQTIKYKKPLALFERYDVILEVTHWDDKYFYMTHTFSNPERVIAEGTAMGAIKSRNGVVTPAEVIAAVEQDRAGRK